MVDGGMEHVVEEEMLTDSDVESMSESTATVAEKEKPKTALENLKELMSANWKYAAGKGYDARGAAPVLKGSTPAIREGLANGQKPIAVVVCCSDSRVPPEVVFEQGLGKLFVVRTAGNRADDQSVLASVQYAVCNLHVPLVIVLGHTKCGAVGAALGGAQGQFPEPDALKGYVEGLVPMAAKVAENNDIADKSLALCRGNVLDVVKRLEADKYIKAAKPTIVAKMYDLSSGIATDVDPKHEIPMLPAAPCAKHGCHDTPRKGPKSMQITTRSRRPGSVPFRSIASKAANVASEVVGVMLFLR